jgi:hypothetical protein
MQRIDHLKQKLAEIEAQLEDAERRMPAHSVKPGQMAALFQLEEERDLLAAEIRMLSAQKVT